MASSSSVVGRKHSFSTQCEYEVVKGAKLSLVPPIITAVFIQVCETAPQMLKPALQILLLGLELGEVMAVVHLKSLMIYVGDLTSLITLLG
jgi:hypothetical protein